MRRFWRCHIAVLVLAAISVHVLPPAPLAQATSVPTIPQRQGLLMSRYVLLAASNNELDDLEEELQAKGVVILHRQDDVSEATVLATQEQIDALANDPRVRLVEPDTSVSSEILDATHDDVIDGQYIVTLRSNTSSSAQEKILNSLGAGVLYMYSQAIKGFAAELSLSQVSALRQNPNVLAVEKDRVLAITESQSDATWGLDRINQAALPLDGVYSYQASGSDVTAYIIDTGVQASHPEFGGRVQAGYGEYAQTDCHGHGTHVAGTVGSSTYGVAKSVQIVPVQVLECNGSGSWSGVIAGMDWVVSHHVAGVKAVANMSLGGGYYSAVNAAVQRMVDDGIVVVVAAGNDANNACSYSPASASAAITVGASTSSDYRASFSNYGSCLDIFAPGQSITSTVMESSIATWSGTSMASPHVAGAAAILWSLHPEWTASEVSSSLIMTANPNTVQNAGSGSPTSLLYISPSVTAPSAPTINSVTGSAAQLTVAFTTPVSNGGATITNYEYSSDNGSTWKAFSPATTSTPVMITERSDTTSALVNGTTYEVMVRAVNSAGSGVASAAMSGVPFTVAGAPTINSVTGSAAQLTVAFTTPVSNGGATITNYEYSTNNGSTWKAFSPATTSTPLEITVRSDAGEAGTQISIGNEYSCALTQDGTVACWGRNEHGQLGNGTTTNSSVPVAVTGGALAGKIVTHIATSAWHSCALTQDGTVACWGGNDYGQLGDGITTNSSVPVAVTGGALAGKIVTHIAIGYFHSCALTSDGVVVCWGRNDYGQLGDGTTSSSSAPVAVTGGVLTGKTITGIAIGAWHSCALTSDGVVVCWGYNGYGQLGDGTTSSSSAPVAVTGGVLAGKMVTRFAAGSVHSCALTSDGVVACWGANFYGTLGDGTTNNSSVPVAMTSGALTERYDADSALVNGTTYQVRVRAVNSAGSGAASAAMSGAPFTVAGAPTINSVTGSDARLTVAIPAPVSNGGATITNYEYSTDNGSTWKAFSPATTSTPLEITVRSDATSALVNGTTYQIRVRALNSAGSGAASAAMSGVPLTVAVAPPSNDVPVTVAVTPPSNGVMFTVARAPRINSVTTAFGFVLVIVTKPVSNGGATITNYEYSTNNGSTWKAFSPADARTALVITKRSDANKKLVKGMTYQVRVRAVSSAGSGVSSTLRRIKAR